MFIQQLLALSASKVTEESVDEQSLEERYETSADFDADMNKVHDHLYSAQGLVQSKDWMKHMKDTDNNFSTSAVELARRAEEKLQMAIDAYSKLYDHLMEAS